MYILVGGDARIGAGYNRGRASGWPDDLGRGGGGATDIRTFRGDLTSRLLVAGGGGGGTSSDRGGNGGIVARRLLLLSVLRFIWRI